MFGGEFPENMEPVCCFKVIHRGGLKVRNGPHIEAEATGEILEFGKIIVGSRWFQDQYNWFVFVMEAQGWVVGQSGQTRALDKLEGPMRKLGLWVYEGI